MQFDEHFLDEMGLTAMPEDQKQRFLAYLQEELEVRIGEQISEGVPEPKLAEFDAVTSQEEAAKWLHENRPDYREIVDRTIEEMRGEIQANREKLLGEVEDDSKTEMTEATETEEFAPETAEMPSGVA